MLLNNFKVTNINCVFQGVEIKHGMRKIDSYWWNGQKSLVSSGTMNGCKTKWEHKDLYVFICGDI